MGFGKPLTVVSVFFVAILVYYIDKNQDAPELPKLSIGYWGPGQAKPDDKTIKKFTINFPASELKELKEKLDKTRPFTAPLEGIGFEYGMNTKYLNNIVDFWRTKYNWSEREAYLNQFPHFTTEIGGLNIHFMHIKPDAAKAKGKEVLPLLLVHGWPGSIREFYDIIPLLTTPRPDADFVFEVIAPSLPGFIFSQASSKPGLGPAQIGVLFKELMARLGYDKFYYQGGDWGSGIGLTMSILFPNNVLGYHSNLCSADNLKGRLLLGLSYFFPKLFIPESRQDVFTSQFVDIYLVESGYFHIQATKPDTVGVALTDSPVGLAAYLLEKYSTGTNKNWRYLPDGGLENLDKEALLDHIMLYWLTKSITSSVRLYKEAVSSQYRSLGITQHKNKVPTACASFKHELIYQPECVLNTVHENLVQMSHFEKGGHFAAFEEPKLLSDDVFAFLKLLRSEKK